LADSDALPANNPVTDQPEQAMAKKSVFDPRSSDTVGKSGLDRFIPPPAQSYSQMPDELVDGETADSDTVDPELAAQIPAAPLEGDEEPVDQIREAIDERNEQRNQDEA
jgi:hypothetical protein